MHEVRCGFHKAAYNYIDLLTDCHIIPCLKYHASYHSPKGLLGTPY